MSSIQVLAHNQVQNYIIMKPVLEQIGLGKEQSILAFNYSSEAFDTPWHFHPQHELTHIDGSVGTKFIGDYVGSYEPGELVLLRSNLPHCWKNHRQEGVNAASTVIQWNKGIFSRIPELIPVLVMIKTSARGLIFDKTTTAVVIPQIKRLPVLSGPDLFVALLNVLIQLSACPFTTLSEARFEDDLSLEFSSRMARIHEFVETHYARKIYLRELAELVSMSEQSFSRFFSKMMGRPFFTFLNEYRINMAARMLIDTDWPVTQIAYACGYDSLPFFYKQFQKFKEISPLKFRERYGQELTTGRMN